MSEIIFGDGIRFERPKEGTPAWVKGKLGIEVEKLVAFLQKHKGESGWVNFDLKESKEGNKLYFQLNTWQAPGRAPTPDSLLKERETISEKLNKQYNELDAPKGDIPF